MKIVKKLWKSEKGFTIQDLIAAMIVLGLFVGIIGTLYVSIYKVQLDTKVDSIATLYAVQIMERVDKLGYEEFTNSTIDQVLANMRNDFSIPDSYHISFEVIPYQSDDLIKTVKMTINYEFAGKERTIIIQRLKVKEV